MDFKSKLAESLRDKPKLYKWWYVSFRDEATDTHFTGATIVQAEGEGITRAFDAAKPHEPEGSSMGEFTEIPNENLPEEQYRNRLLTRNEVETIWPWTKEGK